MNRISSFPPLVFENSKILILGSVPGIKSLEMQQYYAHPRNKFWKILFELFQEDFTSDYTERVNLLQKNHIALWDVIDSCERKGSLDVKIKNEKRNDIEKFLSENPNIKAIFCNGQKAFKNVQKNKDLVALIPIFVLPSTSPAHAVPDDIKLEAWTKIKFHL